MDPVRMDSGGLRKCRLTFGTRVKRLLCTIRRPSPKNCAISLNHAITQSKFHSFWGSSPEFPQNFKIPLFLGTVPRISLEHQSSELLDIFGSKAVREDKLLDLLV